jgi:hypothetical protein
LELLHRSVVVGETASDLTVLLVALVVVVVVTLVLVELALPDKVTAVETALILAHQIDLLVVAVVQQHLAQLVQA